MNILDAVVQLRDDLKTWVTNNLTALRTTFDEEFDVKFMSIENPTGNGSISVGRTEDSDVGENSVALGLDNTASGNHSVAIGRGNVNTDYGGLALGISNKANGANAVAIGTSCESYGIAAVALGWRNVATEDATAALVAGGWNEVCSAYSSAIGHDLRSPSNDHATTIGKYNNPELDGLFIIGYGIEDSDRTNVFRVDQSGNVYIAGTYNSSGADYAEYFEWADGNPDGEDRVGHFVTLDGENIRFANPEEYILGVVSGNPCLIGDSTEDWQGRYEKDVYGRCILEEIEITDNVTGKTKTEVHYKRSNDYDSSLTYVQRKDRNEWDCIGMLGKLVVIDDGTCQVNGFCKCSKGGIATASESGYRVMSRLDDTHIRVLVK